MTNSICIIDDKIPVAEQGLVGIDDRKRLDSNILGYLVKPGVDWGRDTHLKTLITKLVEDDEKWDVSAYSHPAVFIKCLENELIRPEVVVFDWEYRNAPVNSEAVLYEILNSSYVVVYIYSGVDHVLEIQDVIDSEKFKQFRNRVDLINKDDMTGPESEEVMLTKVNKLREENFSFKFGRLVRQKSLEAVERILVDLGKATLNQVYNYFKLTGDSKYDLVDFIGERFKNRLSAIDMEDLTGAEGELGEGNDEEKLIKELWSYRLYFESAEDVVKKGDIVYEVDKGKDHLYLVISDDCDLARFWHKNFGYVSILPLNKFGKDQVELCEKLTLTRNINAEFKAGLSHSSLLSRITCLGEGPFFLPFIKIIEDEYVTYIGFPKEIENRRIKKPDASADIKNEKLKYSCWEGVKPICRLAEPFLSPLVGHISRSLSGFGTPDYAPKVVEIIHKDLKKALE